MFFQRKPAQTPPSPLAKFRDDLNTAIADALNGRDEAWVHLIGMADELASAEQMLRVRLARRPL